MSIFYSVKGYAISAVLDFFQMLDLWQKKTDSKFLARLLYYISFGALVRSKVMVM